MRLFTLVVSLLLVGIGASAYYRWEDLGLEIRTVTLAIPAFVGAGMLLGLLVSLPLRKSGLQLAFLAALMGAGLGLGRLLPAYLKETFDPEERFTQHLLATGALCLVYVLVSVVKFLFRTRPLKREKVAKEPVEDASVEDASGEDASVEDASVEDASVEPLAAAAEA